MPITGQVPTGTIKTNNEAKAKEVVSAPAFNPQTDDFKGQYSSFNQAFGAANKAGLKQFMWNGKPIAVKMATSVTPTPSATSTRTEGQINSHNPTIDSNYGNAMRAKTKTSQGEDQFKYNQQALQDSIHSVNPAYYVKPSSTQTPIVEKDNSLYPKYISKTTTKSNVPQSPSNFEKLSS